jgi:hypothetical protein
VTVESYSLARHEQSTSSGFDRVTTTVALHGPENTGYGEDVTYDAADHDGFQNEHEMDLAGSFTVDEFS